MVMSWDLAREDHEKNVFQRLEETGENTIDRLEKEIEELKKENELLKEPFSDLEHKVNYITQELQYVNERINTLFFKMGQIKENNNGMEVL